MLTLDNGLCVLTLSLAFYLRLGEWVLQAGPPIFTVMASLALALPVLITSSLYSAIFLYSCLPAMVPVERTILMYGVISAGISTFWGGKVKARTVCMIQPILLLLFVEALRSAARVWLGGLYHQQLRKAALPQALIYCAAMPSDNWLQPGANSPELIDKS